MAFELERIATALGSEGNGFEMEKIADAVEGGGSSSGNNEFEYVCFGYNVSTNKLVADKSYDDVTNLVKSGKRVFIKTIDGDNGEYFNQYYDALIGKEFRYLNQTSGVYCDAIQVITIGGNSGLLKYLAIGGENTKWRLSVTNWGLTHSAQATDTTISE